MMQKSSEPSGPCRLCLSNTEFQTLIFGIAGQKLGIQFKIKACFPALQIDEGDGLPKSICYRCLSSLEQTYEFWSKCCTSEVVLSNICLRRNFVEKYKHQVTSGRKSIEHYVEEQIQQSNDSDESQVDDWFSWDATYKICHNVKHSSQSIPVNLYDRAVKRNTPIMCSNKTKNPPKHELLKDDSLQHTMTSGRSAKDPQIKSIPDKGSNNMVSNFWTPKSYNSMRHNSSIVSNKPFYSMALAPNNTFNCQLPWKNDKDCNIKANITLEDNSSQYNDMLASAKHLLQQFRTNNPYK